MLFCVIGLDSVVVHAFEDRIRALHQKIKSGIRIGYVVGPNSYLLKKTLKNVFDNFALAPRANAKLSKTVFGFCFKTLEYDFRFEYDRICFRSIKI